MSDLAVRRILHPGDKCGEGIIWVGAEAALYWTDINKFQIHRFKPGAARYDTWTFDVPVTALARTMDDAWLLVVLGPEVIFWNPATGERRDGPFRLADWPQARSNDAGIDPSGNLWLGTMGNNVSPGGPPADLPKDLGKLVRIAPDGEAQVVKTGIGISNTMCWSPDGRRFYTADTVRNVIFVHDVDGEGGIGPAQVFFEGFGRGHPDGSAMDADGYLWNCRFGGHCIVRIAPDGSIDRVVEMPARNITRGAFGGPDLTTLYVTSAALETDAQDFDGGALFAVETGVRGLPDNAFGGAPHQKG